LAAALLAALILCVSTGCNRTGKDTALDDGSDDGESIFRDITAKEANSLIDDRSGEDDFMILDVRTKEEFDAGHIEGAVLSDFYQASFRDEPDGLDRETTYLVYCRSGNRSGKAASGPGKAPDTRW